MTTTAMDTPASKQYFEYLPVAFFGSVMGLSGLSVAWKYAHTLFGLPLWVSSMIGALAVLSFLALAFAYTGKLLTASAAVRNEFNHPISGNLFGTFFISLLLLPIVLADVNLELARGMWIIGAVSMTVFAWWTVNRWMGRQQQLEHATPAWIVPVVGMLDVPLALPSLDMPGLHDVMIFALAVGLFFAVPLFTLIFSRLLFQAPIPDAMQPSLLILVAPFAVGFSAYIATTGHVDLFAEALFFLTLFILAVLLTRLRSLAHCCPFRVSWWAVSFPLAASSAAAMKFLAFERNMATESIAVALLVFATAVIAGLFARTLFGIFRGELRALST
ncbi:SLAC1 anion channel family protein [Undibacterium sp.]|uniref:SLAC1 anion channel family protein n=1 Tax=Undibacterium sp. TaxID=1914977 RepID=UPI00374D2F03